MKKRFRCYLLLLLLVTIVLTSNTYENINGDGSSERGELIVSNYAENIMYV
ncbi:hypothetical protein JYG23_11250 [Sedimentibacter sp. zth1]|uniref:hypothetical protein n=1 Tax=Sedimentibacter sp. zth1 TaxID=2816908 RepID=UPI001A925E68|nr:hypothetical protein [Sedimentibacter sp. zth1]QSX05248.1 hypothetical protein JYG23_11250 [Sedimentibacter sp. zth1]